MFTAITYFGAACRNNCCALLHTPLRCCPSPRNSMMKNAAECILTPFQDYTCQDVQESSPACSKAQNRGASSHPQTGAGLDNAARAIVTELQHLRKAVTTKLNESTKRVELKSNCEYRTKKWLMYESLKR